MSPADWTPERIREARERCERATPGPWTATALAHDERPDTNDVCDMVNGVYVVSRSDLALFEHDAAFIAHAREDLPAALAWGEQQTRIAAGNAALEASQRAEIERLTAELAVRSPADATKHPAADCPDPCPYCAAWRAERDAAPADASLEARAVQAKEAFYSAGGPILPARREVRLAWLAVVRAADASRPGLTEEQADAIARSACGGLARTPQALAIIAAVKAALLRAPRGETGPAPDPLALDPEDGTLCADCRAPRNTIHSALCSVRAGAKPGRVPDPSPAEEKHTTRTLAWHVRPDAIRVFDEHGRVIASTYPESQEADSHWLVWWQRQPTRRKDHAAPHHRLSKSSALHAIREGLAWWGCDVSRLDMPPPDPRATLHAGDPARCPGPNCKMCNGEACNKCGAGCWNNAAPYCAHGVDERHEPANGARRPL